MERTITELLQTSYSSDNQEEVFECLKALEPDKLTTQQLASLVKHVETICHTDMYKYEHFNIIGTGGDLLKTINVSTISAIVASNIVNVVKLGARGITSKWGSKDFNSIITSKIGDKNINAYFKTIESRFLSFGELGISYGDILVEARRKLNQQGYLDIYKVVFPFSNVTGCTGQVNGVSNAQYLSIFIDLSLMFKRHCIIVHSKLGVDELMPGSNQYVIVRDGKVEEHEVFVPSNDIAFFIETEDSDLLFNKFESIITGTATKDVMNTIYYNAASIINLKEQALNVDQIVNKYFPNKTMYSS